MVAKLFFYAIWLVPLLVIERVQPAIRRALEARRSLRILENVDPEAALASFPAKRRESYAARWFTYRLYRNASIGIFLAYWAIGSWMERTALRLTHDPSVEIHVAYGCFVSAFICYLRSRLFSCPRCGEAFRDAMDRTMPSECRKCGLPLWAPDDPDAENALR